MTHRPFGLFFWLGLLLGAAVIVTEAILGLATNTASAQARWPRLLTTIQHHPWKSIAITIPVLIILLILMGLLDRKSRQVRSNKAMDDNRGDALDSSSEQIGKFPKGKISPQPTPVSLEALGRLRDAIFDSNAMFNQLGIPRPSECDPSLEDQRAGFTGREWLFHELDRFITDNSHGYILIEADAGGASF